MSVDPPQVLQATGAAVFTIEESTYGRIITGMISPDAQITGLQGLQRDVGGIVRVIDGVPTLVTSPLLVRQLRSREVFEMVVSVSGIASWVTAAALALFHIKPWVAIAAGLVVGSVAWRWYVGIQQPRRSPFARAAAFARRAIDRTPS